MEAVLTLVCSKGVVCTKEQDKANLPRPQPLPNSQQLVHYHLVGVDAFAMNLIDETISTQEIVKRYKDLQLQAVQMPKSC